MLGVIHVKIQSTSILSFVCNSNLLNCYILCSIYVTNKPIKGVFFEPDLINATGFYFACQETSIKAVIVDATCFQKMQMLTPGGRLRKETHQSIVV